MTENGSILTFIIVSFCLAIILILKKDALPGRLKKYLALLAVIMVSISFVLILLSFLGLGQ